MANKEKWIVSGFSNAKRVFKKSFNELSEAEHFWNKASIDSTLKVTLERG